MSGRLAGKRCLVTAAAQGIGRASALAFAAESAEVVATDVNLAKLAELDGTAGLTIAKLDVTDADEVAHAAERHGPVDVLFNCAGFVHHGSVLEASEADFDFGIELNVKSMFRMPRAFLPGMLAFVQKTIPEPLFMEMYLSGKPLHVLAMNLVRSFRARFGDRHPISFSAGIDEL